MRTPSSKFLFLSLFLVINFVSIHGIAQSVDSVATAHVLLSKIADYPEEIHRAVLDAVQYPEALSKLKRASDRADDSFQSMTSDYSDEHRSHLLRLSQCPETIDQLVIVGRENPERANMFLQSFSDSARRQFLFGYNNRYDDLLKMDKIYQSLQMNLSLSTEKYPESVQKSFKMIITCPEVVKLLTDNLEKTACLGKLVKSDSSLVYRQLDSDLTVTTMDKNVDAYHWSMVRRPAQIKNTNKEMSDEQIQAAFRKKIRTINTIVTIAKIGFLIYSNSQSHSHSHRRR